MRATHAFLQARDFLLAYREDYETAYRDFRWPRLEQFNWALDYFDAFASNNAQPALWIVDEAGASERRSFDEMRIRSNQVANFLRQLGVRRGDRLLIMLPNVVPLWEVTLATLKLGVVISPATTLLARADLEDRVVRGQVRHLVTDSLGAERMEGLHGLGARVFVNGARDGWASYDDVSRAATEFVPDGDTQANDPFLLYFTSGTTAKPKMVMHTHQSYPVGHLSTMYWLGLRPGDVHYNISSPGWAKHAWSSFFAPWNAGACIFVFNFGRFDAKRVLQALVDHRVTTLCAPPTVWRMLILEELARYPVALRELISAGEPLNPEVIARVQSAWELTIRDGYGQTETTAQVGNTPGQRVKAGSMGRPLPGYDVTLLDDRDAERDEGEIALRLRPPPLGLMAGYADSDQTTAAALGGSFYRTSDTAMRDADGYLWYVGRSDDVFKSSDYRISPFELESILIEHDSVAEAAVVPSPDPLRLSVPKGFVMLKPGIEPARETALAIFRFTRLRLAPYQRLRRLEFTELPKTISGKIRRVQLRALEEERSRAGERGPHDYREEDFPELREPVSGSS